MSGTAGSGLGLCELLDKQGEDFVAVLAGKGQGELGGEQTVMEVEIVAAPLDLVGEVAFASRVFRESGGKVGREKSRSRDTRTC